MTLILVGGGARSGKSRLALRLAATACLDSQAKTFIATAERSDEEMNIRINRHQSERSAEFITVEEPVNLARAISEANAGVIVVDCLTLWLANLMAQGRTPDYEELFVGAATFDGSIIFVTNEVGEGIVPMHPTSRDFRDNSGIMNQRFAETCEQVYFTRFGLAQKIK